MRQFLTRRNVSETITTARFPRTYVSMSA